VNLNQIAKSLSRTPELDLTLSGNVSNVSGLYGGSKAAFISALQIRTGIPMLVISHDAQEMADEIACYLDPESTVYFPSWDTFPTEDISPSKEIIGERLKILDALAHGKNKVVVANLKSAITSVIPKSELAENTLSITRGESIDREKILAVLVRIGYKRQDIVGERGEFAARGGLIDIFPSNMEDPLRIELLEDRVESIRRFDASSQRSIADESEVRVYPIHEIIVDEGDYKDGVEVNIPFRYQGFSDLMGYYAEGSMVIMDDPGTLEIDSERFIREVEELRQQRSGKYYLTFAELKERVKPMKTLNITASEGTVNFGFAPSANYTGRMDEMIRNVKAKKDGKQVFIVSKQADRINELAVESGIGSSLVEAAPPEGKTGLYILYGDLPRGYSGSDIDLLSDREIFGKIPSKIKFIKRPTEGVGKDILTDLKPGDYVVHDSYGIGIFRGMTQLDIGGAVQEYIQIDYANEDKLYVPPNQMGMVGKYSGAGDYTPKVSRLGGSDWIKTKNKAKNAIKDMTAELLDLYAKRQKEKGFPYPPDQLWQMEMERAFPYEETPDQESVIRQIKTDMERGQLIDRLVVGDVGYGKTEVALRLAFKTVISGKQVAVLTPTTVLADQHYRTFSQRFSSYPVEVQMLSRFRTKEEQKEVLKGLADGSVDMVIGTHRLLQRDIKFRDLGLIIVDEEQKFGVEHKEKLKILSDGVNVITLSATPIPRTLHMALSGIREMSIIATPPLDRSPVRTYLRPWDENTIKEVVLRELERGGQVYFVHNYVKTIDKVAGIIQSLVPKARIAIGHGQMDERALEDVMIGFVNHEYDILVSTSIIESGLDIPTVNTVIIDHAENFGLSQLYQIRGRVGRSATRAFAYLLYHKEKVLTDQALERLKAIQDFTALGSGYKLAMADLEIRGAGNIIGAQQSGHMLSIGFDMYCDMLEESVRELRSIEQPISKKIFIDLKVDAFIPADYVSDEKQRIALYKRMNLLNNQEELEDMRKELFDRFGKHPHQVETLLKIIDVKIEAGSRSVLSIIGDSEGVNIRLPGRTIKMPVKGMKSDKIVKAVREAVLKLKSASV